MAGLGLKIIIAAFLLMFLDLLLSPIYPKGGIPIGMGDQVEYFTLLTLLIRIFEILAAFLVVIIHLITHLLDPDAWTQDIGLLIEGVISLFIWLVAGFISLFLHLLALPFIILDLLLPNVGLGIKLNILDFGGILIDFRTLTFQIQIGNFNPFHIPIAEIDLYIKNTVGFTLLGNEGVPYMKDIFGTNHSWYKSGVGAFGIVLDFKDGFETCFPDVLDIMGCVATHLEQTLEGFPSCRGKCTDVGLIIETPEKLKAISLVDEFNKIIANLGIPNPKEWIDSVYKTLIPAIAVSISSTIQSSFFTDIINYIKVRKWQITVLV